MVNQKNENIENEILVLDGRQTSAVLNHISELTSTQQSQRINKTANDDELIRSLSSAYENKRARQVYEWESMLSRNIRTSALDE